MRRAPFGVIVMVVVAASISLAIHVHAATTAQDYVAFLRDARADVTVDPPNPDAAAAIIERLRDTNNDGVFSPAIALDPIISDLQVIPARIVDAQHRLDDLISALALPDNAATVVDTTASQQALHRVYASPVFANLDRQSAPNLLDAFSNFVANLQRETVNRLGPRLALALGTAVVILVLALAVQRLWANTSRHQLDIPALVNGGVVPDPDREWQRAQQAANISDFREAIRRAFRSALLSMATRGHMHIDPAWTTAELLHHTEMKTTLIDILMPAAALFDQTWYSNMPASVQDWHAAQRLCDELRHISAVDHTPSQ